jgi:hypothetical protein
MPDQRIVLDRENLRLLAETLQASQPLPLEPEARFGWALACEAVLQVADLMPSLYGVAPDGAPRQRPPESVRHLRAEGNRWVPRLAGERRGVT